MSLNSLSRKQSWKINYWIIHIPHSKFIYNKNYFPNENLYNPSIQSCIMERWFMSPFDPFTFLFNTLLLPKSTRGHDEHDGLGPRQRMAKVPQWWSIAWNRWPSYDGLLKYHHESSNEEARGRNSNFDPSRWHRPS